MERADGKELGEQNVATIEVISGEKDLADKLLAFKETIKGEARGNAQISFIEIEQVIKDEHYDLRYAVIYREFYEPLSGRV